MIALQEESYPREEHGIWVLFDRRYSGVPERFRSECEAWGEDTDNAEHLDANHVVLVIRPGGALRTKR